MKRAVVVVAFLVLAAGCASGLRSDPSLSSVAIAVTTPEKGATGSGVVIRNGNDGAVVLTASHVIPPDAEYIRVLVPEVAPDGVRYRACNSTLIRRSEAQDLAVLRLGVQLGERGAAVLGERAAVGDSIHNFGLPAPTFGVGILTAGVVSSEWLSDGAFEQTVDAEAFCGFSGGGTWKDGKLVGIISQAFRSESLTIIVTVRRGAGVSRT